MSHVAEGELHAYLDGALDFLPPERASEVREHLRGCAACRVRLEEETALRRRASEVLGLAGPDEMEPPPFEELRERAAAGRSDAPAPGGALRALLPRGARLAWAASVVLALGAGWWSRAALDPVGGRLPVAANDAAVLLEPTGPAVPAAGTGAQRAGEDAAAPEGVPAPEASALETPAGERPPASRTREAPVQAAAPAPGAEVEPAEERTLARARSGPAAAGEPAAPAGATPRDAVALEERREAVRDRDEADAILALRADELRAPSGMAVPGLRTLVVERVLGPGGETGMRVFQELPGGDTLQLHYLGGPAELERSAEAPRRTALRDDAAGVATPAFQMFLDALGATPGGWSQVVEPRSGVWVVARAPLPEAELRVLLRRLP